MIDISKVSGNQIDRANILHSSGIGKTARGHTFGSTSAETFSKRLHTEANRTHIGSYGSANVHYDHRAALRPFSSGTRADITPASRHGRSAPVMPQRTFRDSTHHRFDPYSG